jgi:transcriptional regulator with XRE-family HTH domain
MPTLGQELRKKREEYGSSLQDIALQTKIITRHLQALENDRLDLIPEPYFLKGVLRSYVRAIGADEQYFLRRLAEQTNVRSLPEEEPPSEENRPRRLPWLRIAALILVLAAIGAAAYLFLKTRATPPPVVKIPESATEATSVRAPDIHEPPLKLDMSFTAFTWMLISADGAKVFEGLRNAGQKASFTAEKELLLWIGNAGGFTFKLNGKPGKPLGGSGAVRNDVRITPATLADFQDKPAAAPAVR